MWLAACHAVDQLAAWKGPPFSVPAIRAVEMGWEIPLSYVHVRPWETRSSVGFVTLLTTAFPAVVL
jgi:hypothetical protein